MSKKTRELENSSDLPEVGADASALLQCLCKHLVLADVVVRHGATSKLHRLHKVITCDLRHGVVVIILAANTQGMLQSNDCTTSNMSDNHRN